MTDEEAYDRGVEREREANGYEPEVKRRRTGCANGTCGALDCVTCRGPDALNYNEDEET